MQAHYLQTIHEFGSKTITKSGVSVSQIIGQAALGAALADCVFEAARTDCSKWTQFYADLATLDISGRKAFRDRINDLRSEWRDYLKNAAEDQKNLIRKTVASATVRISELTTISKAMDAAVHFDPKWPIHTAASVARMALSAQNKGSNAGRKAKTWIEKMTEYAQKTVPADRWNDAIELMKELAAKADE